MQIKVLFKKIKNKITRIILKDTIYVTELSKLAIKRLIRNDTAVIFEIGCADGLDTLEFIETFKDAKFTLYCFEPDPRNIASFKKRISDPRVHLFEVAVGATDGTMTLHQSSTIYSSSLKSPNVTEIAAEWPSITFEKTIQVPVISIDSFLKEHAIPLVDFVWADVQGAEDLMLQGAKNSLKKNIRFFYTEYSKKQYYKNSPTLATLLTLLPKGWKMLRDYGTDVLLKNDTI